MSGAIVPILVTMMASSHRRMMDEDDARRRRLRDDEEERRRIRALRAADEAKAAERKRVEQRVVEVERTQTLAERAEEAQEAKRLARSMAAEAKRQAMGRAFPRRCTNAGCREQLNSQGDADSHAAKCRHR